MVYLKHKEKLLEIFSLDDIKTFFKNEIFDTATFYFFKKSRKNFDEENKIILQEAVQYAHLRAFDINSLENVLEIAAKY